MLKFQNVLRKEEEAWEVTILKTKTRQNKLTQ